MAEDTNRLVRQKLAGDSWLLEDNIYSGQPMEQQSIEANK